MKRFRMEEEAGVEGVDAANFLLLALPYGTAVGDEAGQGAPQPQAGQLFRCKSCSREFSSFQALGGHRASRKKLRLAGDGGHGQAARAKPGVHECAVCGLEFAMGQALGGHMRRHRVAAVAWTEKPTAGGGHGNKGVLCLDLDLNVPAPKEKDVDFLALRLGLALPMVDCLQLIT